MKTLKDIQIRRYRVDEYDALTTLWKTAGLPYKSKGRDTREKIAREVENGTAILLFAESEGKIIGTVMGTQDGRKGWINRLAVIPEYRHMGVAQQLVDRVEEEIYNLGIEIIACLIEPDNLISLDFFTRAGYQKFTGIHYMTKRKHPGV
jgi:ribosomal protein S18 acetylase RimI-like enzyme